MFEMKKIVLLIAFFSLFSYANDSDLSSDCLAANEKRIAEEIRMQGINTVEKDNEGTYKLVHRNTKASYYHDKFTGRKTASGAVFNNAEYTAAHKTLPFGTTVRVTNLANGRSVKVKITDRGPFIKGRSIDLSKRAFFDLTDNKKSGVLNVKIEKLVKN